MNTSYIGEERAWAPNTFKRHARRWSHDKEKHAGPIVFVDPCVSLSTTYISFMLLSWLSVYFVFFGGKVISNNNITQHQLFIILKLSWCYNTYRLPMIENKTSVDNMMSRLNELNNSDRFRILFTHITYCKKYHLDILYSKKYWKYSQILRIQWRTFLYVICT